MKVAQWIARHPGRIATVSPDTALEAVVDRMLQAAPCLRDIYVVAEEERVIGHVSFRKLAHIYLAEHQPVHSRRHIIERVAGGVIGDLMDAHFVSAGMAEELDDVIHRQLEYDVEDLPVLDEDGRLLGMINMTAVLREMRGLAVTTCA